MAPFIYKSEEIEYARENTPSCNFTHFFHQRLKAKKLNILFYKYLLNRINITKLFNALVASTVLNAVLMWSPRDIIELLKKFKINFLRKLLHLPRNTSSNAIRKEINWLLNYTYKMLKMQNDGWLRICYNR